MIRAASVGDAPRRARLRERGLAGESAAPLMAYLAERDDLVEAARRDAAERLPDQPFVRDWSRYRTLARAESPLTVLRRVFAEWSFPVRAGMSRDTRYRAMVKHARTPPDPDAPEVPAFEEPDGVSFFLMPTPAGRLPVVAFSARADFEFAWQALLNRNEPYRLPPGVGAAIVSNYNNVERFRRAWAAISANCPPRRLSAERRALIDRVECYRDTFVLAGPGDYGGVAAHELCCARDFWADASFAIRRHHEAVHYVTRRRFGSMRNHLHDELVADCVGMLAAIGEFRADWFLRCLGMDEAGRVVRDARLLRYRGCLEPDTPAFLTLLRIVADAARNLETTLERRRRRGFRLAPFEMLRPLARTPLDELAAGDGARRIFDLLNPDTPETETPCNP